LQVNQPSRNIDYAWKGLTMTGTVVQWVQVGSGNNFEYGSGTGTGTGNGPVLRVRVG